MTQADALGTLLHFGYSTMRSGADLAALFGDIRVDVVVDVRYSRRSRAAAFQGDKTAETIRAAGIARYITEPRLGNPRYRQRGSVAVADGAGVETVLTELRRGMNVAIMCVCRSPANCHRRLVIALAAAAEPKLSIQSMER